MFVNLKHWLLGELGWAPEWGRELASALVSIAGVLGVFLTVFALVSLVERKTLARIQNRYGPNRVGPFGLFQPVADGIKMLVKEDVVPRRADKVVHFLAPVVMVGPAILALGVIPYGRNMAAFSIDAGILFFFAVGSAAELAVFMAGWGSNNKYSMLGAMRAVAQMVSYELPLILAAVPVVMAAGSLCPQAIVEAQGFAGAAWGARGGGAFVVAEVVCVHAVGGGGVRVVFHRGAGGVEPDAVRPAGGRERAGGGVHDGVFGLQIRGVFHGGVFRDVRGERAGGDAFPGRGGRRRRAFCPLCRPTCGFS